MLIHLIGDHKGVVFHSQLTDTHQLLPGEHLAAGVGGVADNDGLCPLLKALFHSIHVKAVLRRDQRDIYGVGPREDGVRAVVLVEGREHQHLVSRVANGHHSAHHSLGAAAGNHNLCFRVDLPANGPALFLRQRLTEILRAEGDGILMGAFVGRFG